MHPADAAPRLVVVDVLCGEPFAAFGLVGFFAFFGCCFDRLVFVVFDLVFQERKREREIGRNLPRQNKTYIPIITKQAAMKPNMMPSSWPREEMGVSGGRFSSGMRAGLLDIFLILFFFRFFFFFM